MIFNKITFIHIPKTAGSSIINSLNKNYILMFKGNKDDFIKEKSMEVLDLNCFCISGV